MTERYIPYGRQDVQDDDIEAVVAVLRSDRLTQGPAVPQFEAALASYCHTRYAVAVNSATSALHLACLALGLGPGDRLWTSPNSFVASANCGRACGAEVNFVDIDPTSYNMSAAALEKKLGRAASEGQLPKVLIPVHFAGEPCDMESIHRLAAEYGVHVVEDASHAVGAAYKGEPVGNCRYSAITVFSFHPVKIVTSGEGGVAVTNDPALADRMARLRSHGIVSASGNGKATWLYEQIDLGFNYRMTDLEAALGASQLRRLDGYVRRRQELARRYDQLLAGLPVVPPRGSSSSASSAHLYPIRILPPHDRRVVFERLRAGGIGVGVHYIPIHTQPYYRDQGFAPGDFPEAEAYYEQAVSLPLYPTLSEDDQTRVVATLRSALQ